MTAGTPRSELSALAARNGLSQHTLTLIKDATLPNLAPEQRLTDAQIGIVHEAVEVCLLSGLTEEQIPQVVQEHRDRAPEDWEAGFWRQRLALANENANRQAPSEQPPAGAEPLPLVVLPREVLLSVAAHTIASPPAPTAVQMRRPAGSENLSDMSTPSPWF